MQTIKNILSDALIGVMIGSTIFLLTIAVGLTAATTTPKLIVGIFIMSGSIGALTQIIAGNWLPFPAGIALHFVLTMLVVAATNFVFEWGWLNGHTIVNFVVTFVVIYALVWLGVYGHSWLTARQMNHRLRDRNRS